MPPAFFSASVRSTVSPPAPSPQGRSALLFTTSGLLIMLLLLVITPTPVNLKPFRPCPEPFHCLFFRSPTHPQCSPPFHPQGGVALFSLSGDLGLATCKSAPCS